MKLGIFNRKIVNDVELPQVESRTLFIASNAVTGAFRLQREGGNLAIQSGNRLIFLAT